MLVVVIMSLYDDIITGDKSDSIKDSKSSEWSGIKLLETHLLSKKKNQAKVREKKKSFKNGIENNCFLFDNLYNFYKKNIFSITERKYSKATCRAS